MHDASFFIEHAYVLVLQPTTAGSCFGGPTTLTGGSGSFDDGSGPGRPYLPGVNCTWIIRPSIGEGAGGAQEGGDDDSAVGVTLIFESFKTVFDDDFMYVRDWTPQGGPGEALALYSGLLPTPMVETRRRTVQARPPSATP